MIGADPAARTHEIRDLHARNSVPFGFGDCDSEEGRAALDRFGLRREDGPVVALYSGLVLVNPSNAEVGQALGADVRPAERTYDVVIVGAGRRVGRCRSMVRWRACVPRRRPRTRRAWPSPSGWPPPTRATPKPSETWQ